MQREMLSPETAFRLYPTSTTRLQEPEMQDLWAMIWSPAAWVPDDAATETRLAQEEIREDLAHRLRLARCTELAR